MSIYTLENSQITIKVKSHGAELCSIVKNGTEHLWQADPSIWARHSPVLFPIVGRVWDNRYRVLCSEYSLPQHGFARDMEFTLISQSDNEISFALESTEETLAKYPFPFRLIISYRLDSDSVIVGWTVENPGEKVMYFQIGAHPAFILPDFDAEDKNPRGYFAFDNTGDKFFSYPADKGCAAPKPVPFEPDHGSALAITPEAFVRDTFIFENSQLQRVDILDKQEKPYISVNFTAPLVALWAPTKEHPHCPFVCIEPWYGRCDYVGYEGDFAARPWMNHLAPNSKFNTEYSITIHR